MKPESINYFVYIHIVSGFGYKIKIWAPIQYNDDILPV